MPIYVNDKQVPLEEIKKFKGEDRVMNMLRKNLSYIEKRMATQDDFSETISLVWTPGTRKYNKTSKMKEGKKMSSMVLEATIGTPQGTKVIRWCEQAIPQPNGGYKYIPTRFKFRKVKTFTWDNIEQLLWLITFSPNIRMELDSGEVIHPGAPITVQDVGLEQRRVAAARKLTGTLDAYIYSDLSPITDEMMRTLASAWGVAKATDPNTSMEHVRNALNDRVKLAEQKRDNRYNVEAFIAAVNERNDFFKALVIIQKAMDLGVLTFDRRQSRWMYVDEDKKDALEITRVPATESRRARDFFADFILRNRKEYNKLEDVLSHSLSKKEKRMSGDSVDEIEDVDYTARPGESNEPDEPIEFSGEFTKDTVWEDVPYQDKLRAAKDAGISIAGKKKDVANKMLTDAYSEVE